MCHSHFASQLAMRPQDDASSCGSDLLAAPVAFSCIRNWVCAELSSLLQRLDDLNFRLPVLRMQGRFSMLMDGY